MLIAVALTVLLKQVACFPVDNSSSVAGYTSTIEVKVRPEYLQPTPANPDRDGDGSSLESVLLRQKDRTVPAVVVSELSSVSSTEISVNSTEPVEVYLPAVTEQNGTDVKNASDAENSGGGASLNLAILPVLGGFIIIVVVCIKCCNRVKADVGKEREYIEDGKPLFRVEPPESHPDYLSSVSSQGYNHYATISGYNPYSTYSSGYNPYNTVTTMMSNVSTASETKDMGTMVKPRDIRRSLRLQRPISVPDQLAKERDLLGDVTDEAKKLRRDASTSPGVPRGLQYAPSPRSIHVSAQRPRKVQKLMPSSKLLPAHRSENVLGVTHGKSSPVIKEARQHLSAAARRQPERERSTTEERESLLDSKSGADSCGNGIKQMCDSGTCTGSETSSSGASGNASPSQPGSPDPADQSPPSSPSRESSPDSHKSITPKSSLKNSSKPRSRTVSFGDSANQSKGENSNKNSPHEKGEQSSFPVEVEITRPSSSTKTEQDLEITLPSSTTKAEPRRKFSLSKVQEADLLSSPVIKQLMMADKIHSDREKDCETAPETDDENNETVAVKKVDEFEKPVRSDTNVPNGVPRSPQ